MLLLPWLAAFLVAIFSGALIENYGTNLPTGDEWDIAPMLARFARDGIDAPSLLAFHNEHRIIVPKLYFYWVAQFTGWNVKWLMFLNTLPLVASAWLLVRMIAVRLPSTILAAAVTLIVVLVLGSWSQWQNFLWAFQFPWFFAPFLFLLGCHILLECPLSGFSRPAVAVLLLLATASLGNGLVCWLAILPLWLTPSHRSKAYLRPLMLWMAGFVLACLVAFAGAPVKSSASLQHLLQQPVELVSWFLYLLGQPLVSCLTLDAGALRVGPGLGQSAGLLTLLLAAFAVLRGARGEKSASPLFRLALGLLAFGFLSGALIAIGRVEGGWEIAAQSRYITLTQFCLLGGLLGAIHSLDFTSATARLKGGWSVCAAGVIGLLIVPFFTTQTWLNDLRLAQGRLKAVLALSHLPSTRVELQPLAHNHAIPRFLFLLDELETAGLLRPPRLDINQVPLSAIVPWSDQADSSWSDHAGAIDSVRTENGTTVLEGWAVVPGEWRATDAVVAALAIDQGYFRIVALSLPQRLPRPDVALAGKNRRLMLSGWRLAVPGALDATELFVLGFDAEKNRFFRLHRSR